MGGGERVRAQEEIGEERRGDKGKSSMYFFFFLRGGGKLGKKYKSCLFSKHFSEGTTNELNVNVVQSHKGLR